MRRNLCIKRIILFIFLLNTIAIHSVNIFHPDSLDRADAWYLFHGKASKKIDKFANSRFFQMTYISVPLIITGGILESQKSHFRDLRNEYVPKFHYKYDDYLQYAPMVAMFGMKAAGVESRSSWGRMLVSDAFSAAIMASVVNILKYSVKSQRPDGSSYNSFPSGHSATAFMAATMFHKEYGMRSPWYSIGGYAVATATAVSRQLNNRHWISDVVVGAGIGILSTELGYYFADLIFKKKGLSRLSYEFDTSFSDKASSFLGLYMGFTMLPRNLSLSPEFRFRTTTGSSLGIEGAWLFNRYVGLGGQILANSVPMGLQTEPYASARQIQLPSQDTRFISEAFNTITAAIGPYFSLPLSVRWSLSSKLLLGYGYFKGNSVDMVWNNEKTGEEFRTEFLKIRHTGMFNMGTGIAFSFWAKKNLGVRAFFDYNMTPARIQFKEVEKNTLYQSTHSLLHSFTLGASVNVFL